MADTDTNTARSHGPLVHRPLDIKVEDASEPTVTQLEHQLEHQPEHQPEHQLPRDLERTGAQLKRQWFVGSIDQGTTSSRFIIFDGNGVPVASHQLEFENLYPQSGYVHPEREPDGMSALC